MLMPSELWAAPSFGLGVAYHSIGAASASQRDMSSALVFFLCLRYKQSIFQVPLGQETSLFVGMYVDSLTRATSRSTSEKLQIFNRNKMVEIIRDIFC